MSKNTLNKPLLGINSGRIGNVYVFEGKVPYSLAWQWQQRLVLDYKAANKKKSAIVDTGSKQSHKEPAVKDSLLLLQHPPVYTLGQGADTRFLRFDPKARSDLELHRIERGGEVTYHCPGQLVGYPILDLHHYQLDLHWYLRALEEVLIRTLARYGLKGERIDGLTGVWLEGYKVAAIGIKVSRWITMHGFALNICPELAGFEEIVPCGLEGKKVGAIAQFIPDISFTAVQTTVIEEFEQVFQLQLTAAPLSNLTSRTEQALEN